MLNYHSSIKKEKSYSDLTVKEISPHMKLNLRGKSREFLFKKYDRLVFNYFLFKK